MGPTRRASKVYRELHVFNRALSTGPECTSDFYLTKSPPCSSLLEPNLERLAAWEFADRFAVVRKRQQKINASCRPRSTAKSGIAWIGSRPIRKAPT